MDLSLEHLSARITQHEPVSHSRATAPRRAAVAVLLRYLNQSPEVLLMRRAEVAGDRWSGHVSFPGGREEQSDPSLVATAVRETREEVGVDLDASARLLGQIDSVRAIARGKILPMSITPFVFVEEHPEQPRPSREAAEVFWLPLARAAAGELDDRYPYRKGPLRLDLPCWRYDGQVIWGLTFDMLSSLLRLIRG